MQVVYILYYMTQPDLVFVLFLTWAEYNSFYREHFGVFHHWGEAHLVMFGSHSWLCTQLLLLMVFGDRVHVECWRLNLAWPCAMQVPYPPYSLSLAQGENNSSSQQQSWPQPQKSLNTSTINIRTSTGYRLGVCPPANPLIFQLFGPRSPSILISLVPSYCHPRP